MQDFWKYHQFEKVLTEDQSPTLRWLASDNQETMHHRGGAYTETQKIYGDPLRWTIEFGGRSAISVGLGLGYNEIMVASEAIRAALPPSEFHLLSFESEAILREQFVGWTLGEAVDGIYDEVWKFFSERPGSPDKKEVQNWLKESLQHKSWLVKEALTPEFQVDRQYEIIFYDAFSSKTSPHLWDEEFLLKFWKAATDCNCLVTTYACTGSLKRSLKAEGFELALPTGFNSKRRRTMGCRGFPLEVFRSMLFSDQ
jgi:tRNA U34 5-methylaminomethyl-2-thiouridine-forming methyltransferase MnmC